MTCQECPKVSTCRKPCKEIEQELRKQGIYSTEYIRPQMPSHLKKAGNKWREIPFSDVFKGKSEPI